MIKIAAGIFVKESLNPEERIGTIEGDFAGQQHASNLAQQRMRAEWLGNPKRRGAVLRARELRQQAEAVRKGGIGSTILAYGKRLLGLMPK